LVAGLVKRLGGVKMRVIGVAVVAPFVERILFHVELLLHVGQARVGQLGIVLAGVVERGDCSGGDRQMGLAPRLAERIADAPSGDLHISR